MKKHYVLYESYNLKTGERKRKKAYPCDLPTNWDILLTTVLDSGAGFSLNTTELFFYSLLKSQGYWVKRLPLSGKSSGFYSGMIIEGEHKINQSSLSEKGVPDFFVGKDKNYSFVEIKAIRDKLNINQLNWFNKHNYETIVLYLLPLNDEGNVDENKYKKLMRINR